MALFNDGPINRIEELVQLDSSLLETATIEGIDLGARISSVQDAMATEILTFLLNEAADGDVAGGGRRRALGVSDVVVNAELKRWHALATLQSVYRDANGHQTNERYQWKWQEFGMLAAAAKEKCLRIGIGLADDPVPRADAPVVTTVPGIGTGGTLTFAVALVNAAGQEGAASDIVAFTLAADTQAQVRPGGAAPANACGWNVYAGSGAGSLARQNDELLAASALWIQPGVPRAGSAPSGGQGAARYVVLSRTIRRG